MAEILPYIQKIYRVKSVHRSRVSEPENHPYYKNHDIVEFNVDERIQSPDSQLLFILSPNVKALDKRHHRLSKVEGWRDWPHVYEEYDIRKYMEIVWHHGKLYFVMGACGGESGICFSCRYLTRYFTEGFKAVFHEFYINQN